MSDPNRAIKSDELEERLMDVLANVDANIRKHHILSKQARRILKTDEDKPSRYSMLLALREEDDEEEE